MKILVGARSGGLISYISRAYGGLAFDRQVMERSDLRSRCDREDDFMSDKGFNAEDIFLPHQVRINLPTFVRNKNKMTQTIVRRNRIVSF